MKKHLRDWRATAVTISTLCFVVSGCQDASSPAANVLVASSSTAKQEFPDDGVSIASNSWRALPSLITPRTGHAAVSLGGCVWTIGGSASLMGTPLSSVERYCPTIDATRWSASAPLPEARADFAGVGVIANKIYAAGGVNASGAATRSLYVYSAATGWSQSPDSLPLPMQCGGGGAVVGGKLYVFAGEFVDPGDCSTAAGRTLAVYNPAKTTPPRWTILPVAPVDAQFHCFFAMATLSGMLHFVGGGSCGESLPSNAQYAYNTTQARWVPATFRYSRVGGTNYPAAVTLRSRILYSGGINGDLWYDPENESWSYDPSTGSSDALPPLRTFRSRHAVAALGNKLIVVGGRDEWSGPVTGSVEQLTLVTGCDIHEPDANKANATPWPMLMDGGGQPLVTPMTQAKICSASDVDNFLLVDVSRSTSYLGFTVHMTPPAGKDYELLLMDSTGTTVLQRSSLVGSVMETVRVPDPGTGFFIRVRSQNGTFSASAPYRLEVVP